MPPFVLAVLKVVFLALLYFFVWRALRAVTVELRTTAGQRAGAARPPVPGPAARQGGKAPRSLVVVDERGGRGRTLKLDGQVNVGRGDACQLQLGDTYVSSFHARLFPRDGAWFLEDLGSTNGTFLNQRRVTSPVAVHAGDKVRVGKTTLELRR